MYYVLTRLNNNNRPTIIDCLPYEEAAELIDDIPGAWMESVTTDDEIGRAVEREINRGI